MINKIENKLVNLQYDISEHLGNTPGNSEKSNKIIDDKEGEIEERFENKLFNIFFDKNKTIKRKDIM